MLIKKKSDDDFSQKTDFVKWFSELNKNSGSVAGGKGANLAEIYNLKINVPPGFVVTAQAYEHFIKKSGLAEQIKFLLEKIDYENTEQLNKITSEIRTLIEKAEFDDVLKSEIIEAYETLGAGDSDLDVLDKTSELPFVAVRSSATTEDLAEASFAGQQDSFLNVKEENQLLEKIKKCFASLFTARATYYRNKKGFKHEQASLAVVVQRMIDSDKSGVIFSKNPSLKSDDVIIEAVFGLGEGIVSGRISPDRYVVSRDFEIKEKEIGIKKIAITRSESGNNETIKLKEEKSRQQVLNEYEIKILSQIAVNLEEHYKKPQDIEFAIENKEIYIVQTRPITTLQNRANLEDGLNVKGEIILTGLAASPGIGYGKIKIVRNLDDLKKVSKGDVLVTKMTSPDMVVTMQKCSAIVTDEGGLTAHASIVSREMGIPAVVGTKTATEKLKEGEMITVNGFTGKIYKGKVSESIQKEIYPVSAETKIKLKLIVDLPSFAERASRTKLRDVGLLRIEGIIAESGKHPNYFLQDNLIKDYEEIIFKGISGIAKYFDEIWVRTSDIRSDEFRELQGSPEEIEANPMLGMHGIRYSLKHPEILKAELRAMKRVFQNGKKIGILFPQIISVNDIKKLKEFVKEVKFDKAKIGVMIETPASVQIIDELCNEGIDFISFGTNDLTQYTLAVDRGNEQVQDIYDEMHPAILHQIEYVIKICTKKNVETSICGQAGSKREMVKFLVENGINSISVNADVASEIAEYVYEIEKSLDSKEVFEDDMGEKEIVDSEENIVENSENISLKENSNKDETNAEEMPKIRGAEYFGEDESRVEGLDIF